MNPKAIAVTAIGVLLALVVYDKWIKAMVSK